MHLGWKLTPLRLAILAGLSILAWWTAAVEHFYGGRWNALYCTGSSVRMPQWLESRERIYRVLGPVGYDGQWFHVLAHDPPEFRESARYMDAPRMRCQRILLPLAAWLLAFGKFEWVDPAYFTLMLLWLGAGVWWTARLAELRGAAPLWGLGFLALPSTMSSIDRMLSDGPLAAAAAGFFFLLETGRRRAAWTMAALAPFLRETGLFLSAAACLAALLERKWRSAAVWLCAGAPFLLWMYELRDLPGGTSFRWKGVFASAIRIVEQSGNYAYAPWLRILLQGMDLASLAGFLLACALSLRLLWLRRKELSDLRSRTWITGALFGAAAFAIVHLEPRHAWDDFYSYGRVFSPVFLVVLLDGLERRRMTGPLLALAPVSARMALQFASPAWQIARRILAW
ncbi:MAG: hypothetical protein WHT08_01725 [Bryobacteraceae bacterium]